MSSPFDRKWACADEVEWEGEGRNHSHLGLCYFQGRHTPMGNSCSRLRHCPCHASSSSWSSPGICTNSSQVKSCPLHIEYSTVGKPLRWLNRGISSGRTGAKPTIASTLNRILACTSKSNQVKSQHHINSNVFCYETNSRRPKVTGKDHGQEQRSQERHIKTLGPSDQPPPPLTAQVGHFIRAPQTQNTTASS